MAITPETPCAFKGNTLTFAYSYSGDGDIKATTWYLTDNSAPPVTASDKKVFWTMSDARVEVSLTVTVETTESPTIKQRSEISAYKGVFVIALHDEISPDRTVSLTKEDSGNFPLESSRWTPPPGAGGNIEFVEGKSYPYVYGVLTANRSRLKIAKTTHHSSLSTPTATQSGLLWESPGTVEVVNDLAVTFKYNDEVYQSVSTPSMCGLFGFYDFAITASMTKKPSGIIEGTSRILALKEIDLKINDYARKLTSQPGNPLVIDPPMIFANSSVLPDSRPLQLSKMGLGVIRVVGNSYALLPYFKDFKTTLPGEPSQPAGSLTIGIFASLTADTDNSKKTSTSAKDHPSEAKPKSWEELLLPGERSGNGWDDLFKILTPVLPWEDIRIFTSPAEMLDVLITPAVASVSIGNKITFKAVIKPKPGLGNGVISDSEATIDLLDGYKFSSLTPINWEYKLASDTNLPVKMESGWLSHFDPNSGTGTYSIMASGQIEVKESDTGGFGNACGVGYATAAVLFVKFFVNSATLGSESYHLGQKIELSYEIFSGQQEIQGKEQKWFVEGPSPVRYNYSSTNFSQSNLISLEEKDMSAKTLTFCLFDFDEEKRSKQGTITVVPENMGKPLVATFTIFYDRPIAIELPGSPAPLPQPVFFDVGGFSCLGYPDAVHPAANAWGKVINKTNTEYECSIFQLVQLDALRSGKEPSKWKELKHKLVQLDALRSRKEPLELKDFEQFLKTIPMSSPQQTVADFWLDTHPPGIDAPPPLTFSLQPNETHPMVFVQDKPAFPLDEVPFMVDKFSATSTFFAYAMVRPVYPFPQEDNGLWCPIKIKQWSWAVVAEIASSSGQWHFLEEPKLVDPIDYSVATLPEWPGVAHGKDDAVPQNPPWRYTK